VISFEIWAGDFQLTWPAGQGHI